jgi:hypothetical protein
MAIINLRKGDQFTVVVPPINTSEPAVAQLMRSRTITEISNVFLLGAKRINTLAEREACVTSELDKHVFERGGKKYHQFNVKIEHYAERHSLVENLPSTVIDQYMEVHGRGLTVSLNGYPCRKFVALKFCMFPYLEVYVTRSPDESFLDDTIQFGMPQNPDDLVPTLVNYLFAAKGDPGSYVEILMKFYMP